eukprot:Clim_evm24s203 gene=Clim_evmTU24s203
MTIQNGDGNRRLPLGCQAFLMDTGNLVKQIQSQPFGEASSEVAEAVRRTLMSWKEKSTGKIDESTGIYVLENDGYCQPLQCSDCCDDRDKEHSVIKLFLGEGTDAEAGLKEAMGLVSSQLQLDAIDAFYLGLPPVEDDDDAIAVYQKQWPILEHLHNDGAIRHLAVSDLQKAALEKFYDSVTIKPAIDHLNSDTCCIIPKDLAAYAKEKGIKLLSHNDPADILPSDVLSRLLKESGIEDFSDGNWKLSWAIRYSITQQHRGIVIQRGYILKIEKV